MEPSKTCIDRSWFGKRRRKFVAQGKAEFIDAASGDPAVRSDRAMLAESSVAQKRRELLVGESVFEQDLPPCIRVECGFA